MGDSKRRIPISPELLEDMNTQEERLMTARRSGKFSIGVPRELTVFDHRVALTPSSVKTLVGFHHRVIIESDCGLGAHFTDHQYSEAGAEIVFSAEQVYQADVILKAAPPTLDEIEYMRPGQVLMAPLHLPLVSDEYLKLMKSKRIIALAMEYMRDESGSYPIVRIMSELAGMSAILVASELLSVPSGGTGVLLGGITGVPPAKVVILGAGVVAENAVRTALGLGAEVRVFDDNVYKLKRLRNELRQSIYTSVFDQTQLLKQLKTADVVIGAIHSKNGRTPMIVTEDMVSQMKEGTVIIDVSIDQGGCFETSEVTTHNKPTFKKYGVIHYCVPNIPSRFARTSSTAVSNIITPILTRAGNTGSIEEVLMTNQGLRNGVYCFKGHLTNKYLSQKFGIKYTDLGLIYPGGL